MTDKIILKANSRDSRGKANSRLRRSGTIPAVVYGHGVKSTSVELDERAAEQAYARAGGNKIIELVVGQAKPHNVLFHDVQHDVRTGQLRHADFYVVRMDEAIKAEVPLHFTGESTAVYQQEGTLLKNLETVEVECLPANLPESIEVDISGLDDFEKDIHVFDLVIPEGVTLLTDTEELVARVEPPRSEEELAELEEAPVEELPEGVTEEGEDEESATETEAQEKEPPA